MLAVAGGKGGCGKTTTAAALARAFARRGDSVAVVDADRGVPDLHVVAGTDLVPGLPAIAAGTRPRAVASPSPALGGAHVVSAGVGDCESVERVIDRVADRYDRVVVDTPAGASPAVAAPLRVADAAVLATTPDRHSLADAAKSAAVARALDAEVVGSVLTRSDGAVDPAPLLECPTLGHVPPVAEPLGDRLAATSYGRLARCIKDRIR